MDVSPQMKNQLAQYQQLQQQLQGIGNQKYQLEIQLKEVEQTLEELGKTKEGTEIFRSIGSLMVKVDSRDELVSDLEDKKETSGIRIKTMVKQEDSLKERYQKLHEELSKSLQGMEQPPEGNS